MVLNGSSSEACWTKRALAKNLCCGYKGMLASARSVEHASDQTDVGYCRSETCSTERVLAKITYTCNTNLASALKNSLCWPLYFNQVVMAAIWYQWGISPCTHYDTRSPVGIWWCWVGSIPEFLQGIQIYNAQIKILYSLLYLLRKKML